MTSVAQDVDTVARAERSSDAEQPYAALGLTEDEYARIREILGRRPTASELAMYSVMWSEHCSYKSSKVYLREFGASAPASDALMVGIGENAGVVDIGQGYAVTFKAESHNHPSYVEPYQGAATGVGGIVRDILAMGARPVGVMDSLRFGPANAADTARVLPGVVAGVGGYGNCLGLPNVGGEVSFDPCYAGNPLVNALCVGLMRHEDLTLAAAPGPGNKVVLLGARTGGDGIGGASVLASASFEAAGQAKRPSVQIGDPFTEKLLIECCLALFRAGLVVGLADLGAAGLSCATSELASAGAGGMDVVLDDVPLRDPSLTPAEILMSESQERMMAVVDPARVDDLLAVCATWDVEATVVGTVTDTGRLRISWRDQAVVDVPPRTVAHEGPRYDRPSVRPPAPAHSRRAAPAHPRTGDELRDAVLRLVGSPELASKRWVTSQYDRYVLGDTVLAAPDDAGVLRVDEDTGLGLALSLDGNGRYCALDPYAGAQLVLAEAYRNVAVKGARPLAVTDCLNFGSPEDPAVMWQFAETVRGLADACFDLGVPVTGGNVSFYNQTGDTPIHPTPVLGVLGVLDDVTKRLPLSFTEPGARVFLLGETRDELGGSAWAQAVHGHLGGSPPRVDLAAERALGEVMRKVAERGIAVAAHDLSAGGLVQALAESCLAGGTGVRVTVPAGLDPFVALFSESAPRAVVAVPSGSTGDFAELCDRFGVTYALLGETGGDELAVEGQFAIALTELRAAHEGALPALFG
ncbi:MAG: phosphoribosylformylglycinamidine synthase subunit PurL [Streptosporangiaceae bacterium]